MKTKNPDSFSQRVQNLALKAKTDKSALSELICEYTKIIQTTVLSMASSTDEVSDLSQEGLMGLCNAVKTYDENKGVLFVTYAGVCVRNTIASAMRKKPYYTDEITEEIEDKSFDGNLENSVVEKVRFDEIQKIIEKNLSDAEVKILRKYLEGKPYEVIASELCENVKYVDNGMQRVRKKLRPILDGEIKND